MFAEDANPERQRALRFGRWCSVERSALEHTHTQEASATVTDGRRSPNTEGSQWHRTITHIKWAASGLHQTGCDCPRLRPKANNNNQIGFD